MWKRLRRSWKETKIGWKKQYALIPLALIFFFLTGLWLWHVQIPEIYRCVEFGKIIDSMSYIAPLREPDGKIILRIYPFETETEEGKMRWWLYPRKYISVYVDFPGNFSVYDCGKKEPPPIYEPVCRLKNEGIPFLLRVRISQIEVLFAHRTLFFIVSTELVFIQSIDFSNT